MVSAGSSTLLASAICPPRTMFSCVSRTTSKSEGQCFVAEQYLKDIKRMQSQALVSFEDA